MGRYRREVLERLHGLLAPLRVARAQSGREDLLEQRGLTVGRGAEDAQVAAADAETGQLADGSRVLVHDDLLATGGTAAAVCDLITQAGGNIVGCSFLAELAFLGGRSKLPNCDVQSLVVYESE